jgi:hypothetical protein
VRWLLLFGEQSSARRGKTLNYPHHPYDEEALRKYTFEEVFASTTRFGLKQSKAKAALPPRRA